MTNTELLRTRINESGYKRGFIASTLGLSLQGFLRKERNEPGSEFRPSEIAKLQELLKLTDSDVMTIFFCPEG